MLWYTREASVAVYVANLPGIWHLLRKHIRFLRDHTNSYNTGETPCTPRYGYGPQYGNLSKMPRSSVRTFTNIAEDEVESDVPDAKSAAQSVHSSDRAHGDFQGPNPFTNAACRTSRDSEKKGVRWGWGCKLIQKLIFRGVIGMGWGWRRERRRL
ncbi:hypothetical protein T440DRAFT_470699 [Plenodomus tracheiphilus IPT5]|uniref:Uncharacterized protein n=1 Tax=Plenodomus tracheiphilus IPT5 TaxID=1408161 RepID=A0A6A7AXQ5_9PLEO|nr:hypothetical protein T440DRAFT_470699 [Plenodomus tracheiphilus IPT5]